MKTIVLILMLAVAFNFMLKETFRKLKSVVVVAAAAGLFVALMWPYAIEQNTSQVDAWLSNPELMLDTSVVLTLEVLLQMAFCILYVRLHTTGLVSRKVMWAYRVLRWFPGIMIFMVMYSMLVQAIFMLPGADFASVAYVLAAIVFVLIPAGSFILRKLLPEEDIRIELLFMSNIAVALMAVIGTVNGSASAAGTDNVDPVATGSTLLLLFAGMIVGLLGFYIKRKFIISNHKN